MMDGKVMTDLLGIAPVAKAFEKATCVAFDGLSSSLERLLGPALKSVGLMLGDYIERLRTTNAEKVAAGAIPKLENANVHASPRLVFNILEESSWIDDSAVQDMWSGLLASSCTEQGDDDSNLIFTDILGRLTKLQAHILRYVCVAVRKTTDTNGLIMPSARLEMSPAKLREVFGEPDLNRLDLELDRLRELGLITKGFYGMPFADVTPTALALNLYVRCQGSRLNPVEFFNVC